MSRGLRVLVVGLGNMGLSHAQAYDEIEGFELAGLCARGIAGRSDLPAEWAGIPRFSSYEEALTTCRPDVVSINTWPDTRALVPGSDARHIHPLEMRPCARRRRRVSPRSSRSGSTRQPGRGPCGPQPPAARFALQAIAAGAHVFVEKPLAETVAAAQKVADAARRAGRKLVVGYILRHHPAWQRFIACARGLGRPMVMRMNLNQQSAGTARFHPARAEPLN